MLLATRYGERPHDEVPLFLNSILVESMKYFPLIASLLFISPAFGQGVEPLSVFSLRGECQTLKAGDEDLLDICADEFMQVSYTDGAVELSVWTDDPTGRFFVFSGAAERTASGFILNVDLVVVSKDGAGDEISEHEATGQCELTGDPTKKPAQYACNASGADGTRYAFAFLTDGAEPENMLD